MAIAVDSSSPIRFAASIDNGQTITSAAFTPPANSFLVCCVEADGDQDGSGLTVATTGLSWSERVRRSWDETTDGGASSIWTATQVSSASRQVVVTNNIGQTRTFSAKVYVLTGVDISGTPVDTVGANNEGGSLTNNINTTSITPGANGLLIAADCDWAQRGALSSSDLTLDTADYPGLISVADGYKVCTSGVGVTGNLDAGGALAAQHKWCQIIVREAVSVSLPYVLVAN